MRQATSRRTTGSRPGVLPPTPRTERFQRDGGIVPPDPEARLTSEDTLLLAGRDADLARVVKL